MLCTGEYAARAQSSMERDTHLRNELRIGSKASILRDGAFRIYIQIQHRRKIEVASGGAQFHRHRPRHLLHQSEITRPAELRRRRPRSEWFLQRKTRAA